MSARQITITCRECDHEHDATYIQGEWEGDSYYDAPEECEHCGADLTATDGGDRASERRQMGSTN